MKVKGTLSWLPYFNLTLTLTNVLGFVLIGIAMHYLYLAVIEPPAVLDYIL